MQFCDDLSLNHFLQLHKLPVYNFISIIIFAIYNPDTNDEISSYMVWLKPDACLILLIFYLSFRCFHNIFNRLTFNLLTFPACFFSSPHCIYIFTNRRYNTLSPLIIFTT